MAGIDSIFLQKVKLRTILVAGTNFGCGSSREQAPLAMKYAGVNCVLAESCARIFFRNSINIGLPVIECEGISKLVSDDDELTVDLIEGLIQNNSKNKKINCSFIPFTPIIPIRKFSKKL